MQLRLAKKSSETINLFWRGWGLRRLLSVLRSAATFVAGYAQCREDVKSSDVLAIADAWLKWVEQPEK